MLFISEHGTRYEEHSFHKEEDACVYFLKRVFQLQRAGRPGVPSGHRCGGGRNDAPARREAPGRHAQSRAALSECLAEQSDDHVGDTP